MTDITTAAADLEAMLSADGTARRPAAVSVQEWERTLGIESLRRLAVAGKHRDHETFEHTERVGEMAVAIGLALGMTDQHLEHLRAAAPLHDVGKIGIPDAILLKPGPLTAQERQIMERHTLIGAEILSGSTSPVLAMAEQIALTHHEGWDGHGYPHGLAGPLIPLAGRIVAVADVFDALTHVRPYKEAWPVEKAVAYILDRSGTHFDPEVVEAFCVLRSEPASASGPAPASRPERPQKPYRGIGSKQHRRSTDTNLRALQRAYGDALRAGDPARAQQAAAAAIDDGLAVPAVHDRMIAPSLRWIGDLWERGAITVGDEHLAVAITQDVLGRLFPRALVTPAGSRERIVLAAAQGEHHTLGLRMAADVLEGAGFDVLYLGADVPLDGLLETCRKHEPAAVGLSVSMPINVPTLIWEIEALSALDRPPAVFAAGRALGPAIEQGLDVPRIDGVEDVVAMVEELLAVPVRRRPVPAGLSAAIPAPIGADEVHDGVPASRDEAFSRAALSAADTARDAARRAATLEHLAFRDGLTDLWNRRAYDDHHARLSDPAGPDATVLMIDVDRFKSINDTYGHAVGDAALITLSAAMLRSVRPGDFVARHGGDEFAVLLPGADVPAALLVAKRIRDAARVDLQDPMVTISIGVSSLKGSPLETSLAVDRALYNAKEQGRDRIVVATP